MIEAVPNVRFLFVGDGIFRDRLERRIAAARLSGHFQFTGLVPPERIPELIAAMDIIVHASLPRRIGAGAAAGLDRRQAGHKLRRGRGAGSCDYRSDRLLGRRRAILAGLTAAMKSLAIDPALRDHLGQEGRRRFTDVFRHERMTEQLRKLYLEVLANPNATTIKTFDATDRGEELTLCRDANDMFKKLKI